MTDNNFQQWRVSYFGFEKELQEQLELCVCRGGSELKKSCPDARISKGIISPLEIHIYFFSEALSVHTQMFERSKAKDARILCIGLFTDFERLLSCIQSGVYGCISILNMNEEIVPAIQSVLRNRVYISPVLAPVASEYFKEQEDPCTGLLTHKETKLLQLLTKGALYKEIAWKLRISENTVRSHVRNIYSKMNVHSKTELTRKILNTFMNIQLFFCFDMI